MEDSATRLRITIFNASGLRAADISALSDPYVVCEVVGKSHTKFRTRAIPQTLEPEWDEEHTLDGFAAGDTLRFSVMDEDNVIKAAVYGDDFLGRAELAAEDLRHGFAGELRLAEAGEGHEDAVLRVSVAVEALAAPGALGDLDLERKLGGADAPAAAAEPWPPAPPTATLPPRPAAAGAPAGPSPGPGPGSSRPRRLGVTIVGAHGLGGLRGAPGEGRDTYCTCEVPGRPHARFKTEVASTSEPTWNRSCEFDYTPGDPLVFTVLDKRIWPKTDGVLGTAVLKGDKFCPYGFDGELAIDAQPTEGTRASVVESLRDTFGKMVRGSSGNVAQATLKVKVSAVGSVPGSDEYAQPQFPLPGQRQQIHSEPRRLSVPTETHLQSVPAHALESQRLKVLIRSARITISKDETPRCDLYCVCQIPGRPGSGFRTRASSGTAGTPVWDQEREIPDYAIGEGLEFVVVGRPQACGARPSEAEVHLGSCSLSSECFLPYGYDAEATLVSPGRGIRGLLRLAVTVGDGLSGPGGPRAPAQAVGGPAPRLSLPRRAIGGPRSGAGPQRLWGPGAPPGRSPGPAAATGGPLQRAAAARAPEVAVASAARPASFSLPRGVPSPATWAAPCASAASLPAALAAGRTFEAASRMSPVSPILPGTVYDGVYLGQEVPSRTWSAGVFSAPDPGYSQNSILIR